MKEKIIIFIDNNQHTLRLLKDYFEYLDKKKLYFSSAAKCMSWIENNKLNYKFIMVSDYDMPGLNGVELLKKLDCNVCVKIILSNITISKEISEAMKNNEIDEYVQKDDIDSLDILATILKKYL